MTIDEFVERLRHMTTFEIPAGANPYEGLADGLGVDSLEMYELVVIVESMAGCHVPPPEVPVLTTLADAFDYFWACRRAAGDG